MAKAADWVTAFCTKLGNGEYTIINCTFAHKRITFMVHRSNEDLPIWFNIPDLI